MNTGWNFEEVGPFGIEAGGSDPGVAHFAQNPIESLVRETVQNSLDASKDKNKPIKIEYKLFKIRTDEFPGYEELKKRADACVKYVQKEIGNSTYSINSNLNVLKSAFEEIEKNKNIELLTISDTGTIGLVGANDYDKKPNNFYKLIFQIGNSSVSGDIGGTWGIGKHAPFASSRIRTVFYSTVIDEQQRNSYFIGKTILSSHNLNGSNYHGTGFYGNANDRKLKPLDHAEIHRDFQKNETGTLLAIAMPDFSENLIPWYDQILISIIKNYHAAISHETLVVTIKADEKKEISLSKSNIREYANELDKKYKEITKDELSVFVISMQEEGKKHQEKTENGEFELYVYESEAKRGKESIIQCMRKPRQKVEEWKFRNGLGLRGVFIVTDDKANREFAKLESVTHDSWKSKSSGIGKIAREWTKSKLIEIYGKNTSSGASVSLFEGLKKRKIENISNVIQIKTQPTIPGRNPRLPGEEPYTIPGEGIVNPVTPDGGNGGKEGNGEPNPQKEKRKRTANSKSKRAKKNTNNKNGPDVVPNPDNPERGSEITENGSESVELSLLRLFQNGRNLNGKTRYRVKLRSKKSGNFSFKLAILEYGESGNKDTLKVTDVSLPNNDEGVNVSTVNDVVMINTVGGKEFFVDLTASETEWFSLKIERV